jgi:hypothetical protein
MSERPGNGRQEPIQAEYHVRPDTEQASAAKAANTAVVFAIIAGVIALAAIAVAGWALYSDKAGGSQSGEIRTIAAASTRQAAQLAAENSKLSADSAKLSRDAATIAALQAEQRKEVTCSGLRRMNLTATTGASILNGGSIFLSQSPYPLPGNCSS